LRKSHNNNIANNNNNNNNNKNVAYRPTGRSNELKKKIGKKNWKVQISSDTICCNHLALGENDLCEL